MDRAAVARVGAVASASLCAVLAGVALAQYIFTLKRKTRRKTKIIEMVSAGARRAESGGPRGARPRLGRGRRRDPRRTRAGGARGLSPVSFLKLKGSG